MAPVSGRAAWWRRVLERAVTPERALQGQAEAKRGWERRAQWGVQRSKGPEAAGVLGAGVCPRGGRDGQGPGRGGPLGCLGKVEEGRAADPLPSGLSGVRPLGERHYARGCGLGLCGPHPTLGLP